MALVLQLLPLLLSRAQGNPGASLDGHPGDRVNLSCVGVSQPTRWVWAPRFPACKGLSKGRRAILLASPNGTPTVSPVQPFAGRLRALDLDIRRLELLLSAGDSGTFICKGRQENESRTELHVLGDRAYCRAPGPTHGSVYPQTLIPLLGAGLVLGLGVLGWACWLRRRSPPHPPRPPPRFALAGSRQVGHLLSILQLCPPPHSSIRESGAPEVSRGGRAQDCRGPGPGAEPALRRPGSYGPQKILPTVPSGPC
ncbi:megakaryocyte and platelet inhibitory receptor G6b isoform X8 [Sagmatias obliquidens]|uniref:megakaryocyte and platelet inhibitory receptor G6b isoform X8 n=1 Tax=Sagmatias obliquidens TaxID=3371155 RepID=UPI000F443AF5|nr:megakaryocyte and platelet inhibitory receptor G6b isoform X8 [Lagenorhynchus obliquidens]